MTSGLNYGVKYTGLSLFVLSSFPPEIETQLLTSAGGGGVNAIFRAIENGGHQVEELKRPGLMNMVESFLVGVNPIAIYETLNSFLPLSLKAIALAGLALANAMALYGSRRILDMEAEGGGRDLQG
ncbi:MAG: hypothetical protein US40_C0013G0027 [Candidatus Roizmanbacteria bacterium GW2011_GWC2_37_13]|uniref:Uncharacterized protein n=1 Tax=Candidatus Roizmanbacteria bacterium GW2011_GWC2_37_13 TaxID=1618486 RepID=A0A0G0GFS2_9BACT|nr:MAG: hypothetical protein US40_C0013G0027 [Candidatus Roizmanbacteria bacterium GW2011_GWC2_37_13]